MFIFTGFDKMLLDFPCCYRVMEDFPSFFFKTGFHRFHQDLPSCSRLDRVALNFYSKVELGFAAAVVVVAFRCYFHVADWLFLWMPVGCFVVYSSPRTAMTHGLYFGIVEEEWRTFSNSAARFALNRLNGGWLLPYPVPWPWFLPALTELDWVFLGFTGFSSFSTEFDRLFLVFYWVWPGLTELDWVFLGFTGFSLFSTGFHLVSLGFTGFYWVFLVFYWVWPGLTELDWVFLGFTGFHWFSACFYRIFTRFYRVLPGLNGL